MTSYSAYSNYKPSNLDWLGAIPNQWKTVALHYVGRLKSGESITALQFNEDGEYPVYGGNGFRGNYDRFTHDGDYVLIGRQGALCGNINIVKGKFFASEHAIVVNPDWVFDTNWMGYQLLSMNLNQYSVSAAQPGLSAEVIGRLKVAFPPLDEQQAIARFLDFKTAQIDALIIKKQFLLDKLAEKRTALISHAVTKGLDPSVPMKDSGVAWMGDVPKHWNIKRIKNFATHNDESLDEQTAPDFEIDYIDISSVSLINGIEKSESMLFEKAPSRARRKVKDGDIIVSTVRTYLKAIAAIINPPENMIVSTGFAVIRPKENLHSGFAGYLLQSNGFVGEVVANSVGVSYPAINASALVRIAAVEPPFEEQQAIARFLDEKTAQIHIQRQKIEDAISKLQEYRLALITNAVTGKIDVRGFQAPQPAEDTAP